MRRQRSMGSALGERKACSIGVKRPGSAWSRSFKTSGGKRQGLQPFALIPLPGVGDERGDPFLEGGSARGQKSAKAPLGQDHTLGVDLWSCQQIIKYMLHHNFPVRPQRQAIADEIAPLPRPIEQEAIVAAAHSRWSVSEIHLLNI